MSETGETPGELQRTDNASAALRWKAIGHEQQAQMSVGQWTTPGLLLAPAEILCKRYRAGESITRSVD